MLRKINRYPNDDEADVQI